VKAAEYSHYDISTRRKTLDEVPISFSKQFRSFTVISIVLLCDHTVLEMNTIAIQEAHVRDGTAAKEAFADLASSMNDSYHASDNFALRSPPSKKPQQQQQPDQATPGDEGSATNENATDGTTDESSSRRSVSPLASSRQSSARNMLIAHHSGALINANAVNETAKRMTTIYGTSAKSNLPNSPNRVSTSVAGVRSQLGSIRGELSFD
jgi:hypothetical protein